jgi:hypothetical protein
MAPVKYEKVEFELEGTPAKPRLVIVCDGRGWFVRRLAVSIHDGERNEQVYRCDAPIGGKYKTIGEAVRAAKKAAKAGRFVWKRRRRA